MDPLLVPDPPVPLVTLVTKDVVHRHTLWPPACDFLNLDFFEGRNSRFVAEPQNDFVI